MTATTRRSIDREWAAARRAAARAHHPDLGGDPDDFIATLTAIDATYGRADGGWGEHSAPVTVVVRHAWLRRAAAGIPRMVRRAVATRRRYARL